MPQTVESPELPLSCLIESLLFVADGPVSMERLAQALGISANSVKVLLRELEDEYQDRGLRLQWSGEKRVQLTTVPEAAGVIEHFLGLESTSSLSSAATEALAIIAYRQPITRPQVDSIRGVNSDGVIRTLLTKGLIEDTGRAPTPGRPIIYSTTPVFLQHFGLLSLEELPQLEMEEAAGE